MGIILIENQTIEIKWSKRTKEWYENLGYHYTYSGDKFIVKAKHLSKGAHYKVKVRCDYCGEILDVVWKDYVSYKDSRYACSHCRQTKTSEKTLKQRQIDLYQQAIQFCNYKNYVLISPMDTITDWYTKVLYICPRHDVQETTIGALILKHGCSYCAYEENGKKLQLSINDVENTINEFGGILLNKDDYTGWSDKNLQIVCPECGDIFITSYNSFIKHGGQRCPLCTQNESSGERKIRLFLEQNNIGFVQQYRFENCKDKATLPFDFYLPQSNTLIEYDGEGHYTPIKRGSMSDNDALRNLKDIKKRDNIKTDYCYNNDINLIRIPYWDFNDIENILQTQLT